MRKDIAERKRKRKRESSLSLLYLPPLQVGRLPMSRETGSKQAREYY
jgi:hypothetical protein